MTASKIALGLFCLLANSDAHLRSKNNDEPDHRELQVDMASFFNGLVNDFSPALEGVLQNVLAESFDPIVLGDQATVELGSFELPLPLGGSCQTSASATYGLGSISGLSNFNINSLELVPGSETFQPIFFGLGGATWSGTWILNATFDSVSVENSAGLKAQSCLGDPIEQTLTGTTTLNQPSILIKTTLAGETSNLLLFAQTSQITSAEMEGLDFELGTVDAGFGGTGTIIPAFDLSNSFDAFLLNEFSDVLEPLMIDAVNNALADALPLQL